MSFQSAVFPQMGFGVVGELFDDGPVRSEPWIIVSASALNNVFGNVFTTVSNGIARAGNPDGLGVFAGFLVNPKGSTTSGTAAGGSLAPTLTLPNNSNVELLTMGSIIVSLPAAAKVGDLVLYDAVTGALTTVAPGSALPSGKYFAQATVDRFDISAASLAVIQVTNVPVPPT